MNKASDIRKRQGFYQPHRRTKPTLSEGGPREPGAHGRTRRQPRIARVDSLLERLMAKAK